MKALLLGRSWKASIVRVGLILTVLFAMYVLIQSEEHHSIPEGKVAAMEMLQRLSEPLKNQQKDTNRYYFSLTDGSQVGVDFSNKVLVLLAPKTSESNAERHCFGYPDEAVPRNCHSLDEISTKQN